MGILTVEARRKLKPSDFVFPDRKAFPIHDEAHARDALARSSGKPEAAAVKAAVKKKWPGIKQSGSTPTTKDTNDDGQAPLRKMWN